MTAVKHYCPACGSFMGLTHESGESVLCSYADYDDPTDECARVGFAFHPEPHEVVKPPSHYGRKWLPPPTPHIEVEEDELVSSGI